MNWVFVNDSTHRFNVSATLAEAQARLLALRGNVSEMEQLDVPQNPIINTVDLVGELPAHLGWHSQSFTKTVRRAFPIADFTTFIEPEIIQTPSPTPNTPHPIIPNTVSLYPDLAIKILQEGEVATARIWLLLRHMDVAGRGWLKDGVVRSQLSGADSGLRVCGWRQLRKLLHRGDGLFWNRENGKVWLRSPIKVAAQFGVERFSLQAVKLPIARLRESIATVRSHFYSSFHSGRGQEHGSAPISRETLSQLTNLSRPTQRAYEKLANISCQTNICVSEISTPERKEQLSSEHGHALFEFTDYRGKLGKRGTTYFAWQLPNSYSGCHELLAKGHQKRLNRRLADLFTKGMTGNSKDRQRVAKRFFTNGAVASHRAKKGKEGENRYWRSTTSNKVNVWHGMPA